MASFSAPCTKIPALFASRSSGTNYRSDTASFPRSDPRSEHGRLQGCCRNQSGVFKVCAKVSAEKLSNSNQASETVSVEKSDDKPKVQDTSSISVFMTQVSDLIQLVDSRDIVELQLKQMDCELLIRKKEALPQPAVAAPVTFSPFPQQAMLPHQLPPTNGSSHSSVGSVPPTAASLPSPPTPTKPKSSLPPFKCPMAGNFYRSPGPGEPPFVKVGDKIQKGQVICIIEAMKLMNEIEAEKSGTVVDILVDDGKPVSVDMPLFIIEP